MLLQCSAVQCSLGCGAVGCLGLLDVSFGIATRVYKYKVPYLYPTVSYKVQGTLKIQSTSIIPKKSPGTIILGVYCRKTPKNPTSTVLTQYKYCM